MRRVVRIATYLPRSPAGAGSGPAVDEDEFTLAATAVERAWSGKHDEPTPVDVHLLGQFPAVAEWGFSSLLGRDTHVARHPGNPGELAKAVRAIERGEGGPALLVAAELPRPAVPRSAPAAPRGAGAVAFRFEPTDDPAPFPLPRPVGSPSALAAALRIREGSRHWPASVVLGGDWEPLPEEAPSKGPRPRRPPAEPSLTVVSEGAFVPRPRYLENLPSRWRFLAEACRACRGTTFPSRGICRRCGRTDALTTLALPFDGGRVAAVTTVGKGGQPTEFDAQVEAEGPYDVALVELARGMRVTLQVTDAPAGTLRVGDRVNTLLRRLYPMEGEWRYGRKAVPATFRPERVGAL